MTTLKEIEAEFISGDDMDEERDAMWADKHGNLLIRAVRQLGALYKLLEDYPFTTPSGIDPDVLALLEEHNE